MRAVTVRIQTSMSAGDALNVVSAEHDSLWPLFEGDRFVGMISTSELKRCASEKAMSLKSPARGNRFPHVHSDHTLDVALQRMGSTGQKMLPVVSRSDIRNLEGIVALEDVLGAYGLSDASPTSMNTK